jgi:hypothetical protein
MFTKVSTFGVYANKTICCAAVLYWSTKNAKITHVRADEMRWNLFLVLVLSGAVRFPVFLVVETSYK